VKHFVVLITYTASLEEIDAVLADHRAFLQEGYDAGMLLCSGPRTPRTGGVVIARAESLTALADWFARDPYRLRRIAEYEFIEFCPVKRQDVLHSWVEGR